MATWEGRRVGGTALAALASTLLAGTALAQMNPAQKALEEQGRYWEDRHQPARAEVAWQKLVESDSRNAEALLHLGMIEARAGHADKARDFARQLHAAHPENAGNEILDHAINVGAINVATMDRARELARGGQYEAAMAVYRQALKGQPPPPDLAREYYETLAGTKTGWPEARHQLQEMAAALPDNLTVQYGYARVLTYHEETRRQGIAMLAAMAGDPSVGRQTNQAWHDALLWLGASKKDVPLYKNYLASHADDPMVEKKLAALQSGSALASGVDAAHARALDALNAGHLREAGQMFEALLRTNPKDADALGGLGVVREREGNLREARNLLSRAVAAAGDDSHWRDALASAVYLDDVADAKAALRARNWKLAEERARAALQHPYGNDRNAEMVLAQVYQHTNRSAEAEKIYHRVHAEEPRNREAAAGSGAGGRGRQPQRVARRGEGGPGPEAEAEPGFAPMAPPDMGRAAASRLAEDARAAIDHGNVKGAVAAYRQAIARDPANPWIRLDYARLLTRVGDRAGADRVIQLMVGVPGPSGDAVAAAAIWYGEHGDYQKAALFASRVPPSTQVGEFASMQHQWIAERDAHQAVLLARQGRLAEAQRILDGIIAGADGNIGVIGVAADGYIDLGDPRRGVSALRHALGPHPSLDDQIQYAGVLLRVSDVDEMKGVMHDIDTQAGAMRPAQQARVADLHRGLSIKLSDEARLRGDYSGAYDRLAPELAISRDPTVLAALARIYDSAGRHEDALQIYTRIMHADPSNMDVRREIIGAAIRTGEFDRARQLLNQGLAAAPDDPRLHVLAAELARAEGDDDTALAELAKAQAELARREPHNGYSGNPFAADNLSPFARPAPNQVSYSAYQAPPSHGNNPAYPVPQLGGPITVTAATTEDQQLSQQVQDQIEQVRDPLRPFVQGGVFFRNVDGEAGLSQFSLVSLPMSGGARVGPGTLTLEVEPTSAGSGTLDNTESGAFRQFGTNATLRPSNTMSPYYDGHAEGVGVKVGYQTTDLSAELGSTPIGFPNANIIGHAVWLIPLDSEDSIKLTGLRDPVMDSLLSYAGTKDPLSGASWGGVTRTGGRIDIGYDNGRTGVYGDATGAFLDGKHVESNFMVDAGAGAYWRFYRTETGGLKVGVNLSAQTYNKNLDFYSFGQGGYFSPQAAVEATIPVEYTGKWNRISYAVNGQLGMMNFHENSSPYFPLDPNLQALAERNNPSAFYPGQTVTTPLYGINAKAEYEVEPLLILGASVSADNSYNYNEQSLLIYLRKKFDTY